MPPNNGRIYQHELSVKSQQLQRSGTAQGPPGERPPQGWEGPSGDACGSFRKQKRSRITESLETLTQQCFTSEAQPSEELDSATLK